MFKVILWATRRGLPVPLTSSRRSESRTLANICVHISRRSRSSTLPNICVFSHVQMSTHSHSKPLPQFNAERGNPRGHQSLLMIIIISTEHIVICDLSIITSQQMLSTDPFGHITLLLIEPYICTRLPPCLVCDCLRDGVR